MNTEQRISFLVNECTQFVWLLRENDDKDSLEDFRERLRDVISFADVELRELKLKTSLRDKLKTIYEFSINKSTSEELEELLDKVIGHLDTYTETLNTSV